MPEGPEIRRVADHLADVLLQRPLSTVWFRFPHLQAQAPSLLPLRIRDIRSWGKALLIEFDDGRTLYSHNQLYGRWFIRKAGTRPATNRDLRVALETPTHAALLYSASEIELLDPGAWRVHPFLGRLGPDVFAPGTTPAFLRRRLRSPRFRKRTLGGLLMDQQFLAGLGNYLRSEILFAARLHPDRRAGDLDDDALALLARQIRALARRAYLTAGETAPKAWVRARQAAGLPRRACRHLVFERDEEPCPACGTEIRRMDCSGRRLYFCPRCQPTGTDTGETP
ncbi:MAG: endonuclease VIII [Gammaproteobacteria bacterium]|nr:endonuclease VIII [Gammaproteobacteria bacterium]